MSVDPWNAIFFDSLGLIVQRDGDGGDTAQREGWIWFAEWYHRTILGVPPTWTPALSFQKTLDLLELGTTGEFRRHPTQPGFPSDPDTFSRDQIIPLVAAMGVHGDTQRLLRSRAAMRSCYIWAKCVQGTTDLVSPELVNHYRRGLGEQPDATNDGQFIGGVATRVKIAQGNPEDVGDDLNMLIYLAFAFHRAPTGFVNAALAGYLAQRPVCAGCYMSAYRSAFPNDFSADERTQIARIRAGIQQGWIADCHPVVGALRWYFRYEAGGSPLLAEIYKPIVADLEARIPKSLADNMLSWPDL
jgi:hypothetical protein